MVGSFLKSLRKQDAAPVETLDVEAIRSRIGDPLPPKRSAEAAYVRMDERPLEQRNWRKVAGLTR